MRLSTAALLAPVLCLAAACAVSGEGVEEDVDVATQAACTPHPGTGCTILRPVGWNVNGLTCVEGPKTPIGRADGQSYTAIAVPSQIFGSGFTTLLCDGGCLKTTARLCRHGGIEP
ncbi:MAG: hypothetical protein ACREBE_05110 [bacterium]